MTEATWHSTERKEQKNQKDAMVSKLGGEERCQERAQFQSKSGYRSNIAENLGLGSGRRPLCLTYQTPSNSDRESCLMTAGILYNTN